MFEFKACEVLKAKGIDLRQCDALSLPKRLFSERA